MQIDTTDNNQNNNNDISDQQYQESMREAIAEFMQDGQIKKRIKTMLNGNKTRFAINIDEVRQVRPDLAKYIQKKPIDAISKFENQLDMVIKDLKEDQAPSKSEKVANATDKAFPTKTMKYYVNFEGNFGANFVTPRGLKANLLNQFVSVRGIVTRMGMVKPKVQTSVHYCEATKKGLIKHYSDQTNMIEEGAEERRDGQTNAFPTKDQNDNPLTTEYGYCVYKDSQEITIQEMPENAPTGQLPRSVQVILENDLINKLKPGDRVEIQGVYKPFGGVNAAANGIFKTMLIATGVKNILEEKEKPLMSEQDIKNIRKMSQEKQLIDILGGSIAPSIEGSQDVKKSLLLQLIGGQEKVLPNGTHLRGDINIMMVGDPSTAKSQLLRHIMDIAPLAINTTGRGSTGVGLTAAVSVDKDTGDKHLEAGAMVLADKGIVCIDEFDKMNDNDRVAIHEVMEQQTVTIAKAGIHTSLNARCSVIAAANPIYGEYARDQPVSRNIGLPDSLLSRFDLLFVMLDEKDPTSDRKIAEKVITNHRYQHIHGNQDFSYQDNGVILEPTHQNDNKVDGKGTTVYEKTLSQSRGKGQPQIVTRDFLKKYINFAKSQKAPEMHGDCIEWAANFYSMLRENAAGSDQNKISVPVTVRTLETIIRLATAHARLRLSKSVSQEDCDVAAEMVRKSIFPEQRERQIIEEEEEEEEYTAVKEEMVDDDMEDDHANDHNQNGKSNGKNGHNSRAERSSRRNAARGGDGPYKVKDDPMENTSGRQLRSNLQKRVQAAPKEETTPGLNQPATKKMKIDPSQQVDALFSQASQVRQQGQVDVDQKKVVFKMLNSIKDGQNKSTVDDLWKKYLTLNERESNRRGTMDPLLSDKNQLIEVVEALERDNMLMYAAEDNQVILM